MQLDQACCVVHADRLQLGHVELLKGQRVLRVLDPFDQPGGGATQRSQRSGALPRRGVGQRSEITLLQLPPTCMQWATTCCAVAREHVLINLLGIERLAALLVQEAVIRVQALKHTRRRSCSMHRRVGVLFSTAVHGW